MTNHLPSACGIHLFKYKVMRPEDRWNRDGNKDSQAKKRPPKYTKADQKSSGGQTDDAGDSNRSGQNMSKGGDAQDDSNDTAIESVSGRSDRSQSKTTGARQRPSSAASTGHRAVKATKMSQAAAAAALHKAFQSSPPKFPGSQTTPIDIESTASPVRRVLFPSPCKPGEAKSADPNVPKMASAKGAGKHHVDHTLDSCDQADKENRPPDHTESLDQGKQSSTEKSPASAASGDSGNRDSLVTPKKSSAATPHGLLSTTKRWLGATETPSRTAALRDADCLPHNGLSPFSAQLTKLIAQASGSPSKQSPNRRFPIYDDDLQADPGPRGGLHHPSEPLSLSVSLLCPMPTGCGSRGWNVRCFLSLV